MPYPSEGTLTTDAREVAVSETWNSDADWNAAQSMSGVVVENGVVMLEDITISDSVVAQYDATEASTGSITSITDQVGSFDLSGSCSVISSGINGNQSFRFDGADDAMANESTIASTDPWAVIMVVQQQEATGSDGLYFDTENSSLEAAIQDNDNESSYRGFRGESTTDSGQTPTTSPVILAAIFDNTTDYTLRVDGSQVDSDSLSSGDLNGFVLAARATRSSSYYLEVDYGEVVILENHATNDIEFEESRLSDKWGISL